MKPMVVTLESHKEIKDEILELISLSKKNEIDTELEKFTTDFRSGDSKLYFELFWKHNKPIIDDIVINTIGNIYYQYNILEYWFQQYSTDETHAWHFHPHTYWNFIYYVDLPEGSKAVEVIEPFTRKQYIVDAKEGDLVFFPAQYCHRSPLNQSKEVKTIIAFNLDYLY